MGIAYDDRDFEDPRIAPDDAVAAADAMGLRRAAEEIDRTWHSMVLPTAAEPEIPEALAPLIHVDVDRQERIVVATVGTGDLEWDLPRSSVRADTFLDYTDTRRHGVAFEGVGVSVADDLPVVAIPAWLREGGPLTVWCAELPGEMVAGIGHYELLDLAHRLTTRRMDTETGWEVHVPAIDIDETRQLAEIVRMNWKITDIRQTTRFRLGERGGAAAPVGVRLPARVGRREHRGPVLVLGAHGPVLAWLTAYESPDPFSVVLTTADAWAAASGPMARGRDARDNDGHEHDTAAPHPAHTLIQHA